MRWGSPHAVLTSLLGVEGAHFFGALLQDFFIDKHTPGRMIVSILENGVLIPTVLFLVLFIYGLYILLTEKKD